MKLCILLVVALAVLTGCAPPATLPMAAKPSDRVKVTLIGTVEDELAYGERRGIYLIVDTKTDKEFIGVSGVGITEVGVHGNGKSSTRDER